MSSTFTLELPNDLADQARKVAKQSGQPVEAVLLDWLGRGALETPVEQLPDAQVLTLCDTQLDDAEQAELSELLARQREGELDVEGHARLDELLGMYRRGMTLKARALKVAVERGLRPPLR